MNFQSILENLINWLLSHGLKIAGIIIAAFFANRAGKAFIERIIRKAVKPTETRDGQAEKKREDTLIRMFNSVWTAILWTVTILMILPELGINIGPLLAGAGIVGIAIGFGAQKVIQDFLAGFFIVFEDQYRVGDSICINNICGGVEDLNLRRTILRSADGVQHIIPNGQIKVVSNRSKEFSRVDVKIGVAYKENVDKVLEILDRVSKELAEDPGWKDFILTVPKALGIDDFGESALMFTVRGDVVPGKQWDVARELRKRIKIAFDKEGIEIPFPQISIWPKGKWSAP
jgi:small conductance mechanosensitive channel